MVGSLVEMSIDTAHTSNRPDAFKRRPFPARINTPPRRLQRQELNPILFAFILSPVRPRSIKSAGAVAAADLLSTSSDGGERTT